jgi:hypothetical protein
MKTIYIAIFLLSIFISVSTYTNIHNVNEIYAYYEVNSYYPILHLFYNRHFAKSTQFQ